MESLNSALRIYKDLYGEKNANVAITLNLMGSIHNSFGDSYKSIEYQEKSLKVFKELSGDKPLNESPNANDIASTIQNIGVAYDELGEEQKAIEK